MTTATKERKTKSGGIRLSAPALKKAMSAIGLAISSKSLKPILQNALLSDGVLIGSDGELRIEVALENAPPGVTFLLPYYRLLAILNIVTTGDITLRHDGTSCVVKSQSSEWVFPTESADEYPLPEPANLRPVCSLPGDHFEMAARAVSYAVDSKSSRYALGAVNIEVDRDAGKVVFVATDGRRLATFTADIGNNKDPDTGSTLVSQRAMSAISSFSGSSEVSVDIHANGNQVVATIGSARVVSAIVDGKFPRWRDAIPSRSVKPSQVCVGDLLSATKQAQIVTTEGSKGVTYTFSHDEITLHAVTEETGKAEVRCKILSCGKLCDVKLDPRFVIDLLNSVDEQEPLVVDVASKDEAVIFKSSKHDDEFAIVSVIMPLAKD
jgi:DNA polymerase-3 subunit beta